MTTMLRSSAAAFFLILGLFPALGQAPPGPTSQGFHSRVRLLSGGQAGGQPGGESDSLWLAGIEIVLDPGFKTYWRTPGESGLPPRFDWSGSQNVKGAKVLWPAPKRQEDAGGVAYVYGPGVLLPVLVTPEDPSKPVRLALAIEYGVCKDICIPASARLTVALNRDGPGRAVIESALAAVPRPKPLGADSGLAVTSIAPREGSGTAYTVTVNTPGGAPPVLFAEGPDAWYLSTSAPEGGNRFTLTIEDRPKDASGPVPVRLTLVAGDEAIETDARLDAGAQPR